MGKFVIEVDAGMAGGTYLLVSYHPSEGIVQSEVVGGFADSKVAEFDTQQSASNEIRTILKDKGQDHWGYTEKTFKVRNADEILSN